MTRTKPNPDQPDRCPSIDPFDTLQCGRKAHDDDQCRFGGIAWRKGEPPHLFPSERARAAEGKLARVAELTARLEGLDAGKPGVIGWLPASVLALDMVRELRAILESPGDA